MQDFKRNSLFGVPSKIFLFLFYINYESTKLFKWVCRLGNLKIWNLYFDELDFWARDTWHTENLRLKTTRILTVAWTPFLTAPVYEDDHSSHRIPPGEGLLLFRALVERRIMTNTAYETNNRVGLLWGILCSRCKTWVVRGVNGKLTTAKKF